MNLIAEYCKYQKSKSDIIDKVCRIMGIYYQDVANLYAYNETDDLTVYYYDKGEIKRTVLPNNLFEDRNKYTNTTPKGAL